MSDDAGDAGNGAAAPGPEPLRSVHTTSFAAILNQLRSSLLVSTYQAGKLVVLRPDAANPELINTHFRAFNKPMGLAVRPHRLAVGGAQEIWEFHDVPAVSARLEPKGKHDACFLPRWAHVTGDIAIHEMAYCGDELWFINTQFSCLCTLDGEHSFVPRWRPRFVSALAPGDRCHVNGMAVVDGRVKYVTALGETDLPGGWRENKKNGGLLIDIETHEILCRGLSMPHSPRWHDGRLWLQESGTGTFGYVDLDQGSYVPIVELPGFTRGLDFYGNLAFMGLSQVRETAVFSGIPLTQKVDERTCGVWVIDIRNGTTVAFLKFEDAVQEIFAVSLLLGARYPDIVNEDPDLIRTSYVLPDAALAEVPDELRAGGEEQP